MTITILLLLIPTIILSWFIQNCIHELSHLAAAWLIDERLPYGFYPYPHKYKEKFYFARYRVWPGPTKLSKWVHIAPCIAAGVETFIILILLGLLSFPWWSIFLFPLLIAAQVDAIWFWRGYFWGSKNCDGKQWKRARETTKNN